MPVRVRCRWAADDVALARQDLTAAPSLPTDPAPLPSGADDPGAGQVLNSGLVTRLHDEVYARLHHGRLVLIGGLVPGLDFAPGTTPVTGAVRPLRFVW
jgi:hypothetical protein